MLLKNNSKPLNFLFFLVLFLKVKKNEDFLYKKTNYLLPIGIFF